MWYKNVGISFCRFVSERELMFMFAICRRPSVCLSVCRLSSVTFVHPTQAIEIFGNVSAPCNTLVT